MSLYALKFKNHNDVFVHVKESFYSPVEKSELLKCNVATNVTIFPTIEKANFYYKLGLEKGLELEIVKVQYKLEVVND